MPFIDITLLEGRSPQVLESLLKEVTDAVARSLDVAESSVRVVLRPVAAEHWAVGGVAKSADVH